MRRAVTIARKGEDYQVLSGPEVPLRKQIDLFKKMVSEKTVDFGDEIEIWTSDSRIKRYAVKGKKSIPVIVQPPVAEEETPEEEPVSSAPVPPSEKGMQSILQTSKSKKS